MDGMLNKWVEDEAGWEFGDDVMKLVFWRSSSGMNAESRQVQAPWQLPRLSSTTSSHLRRCHSARESRVTFHGLPQELFAEASMCSSQLTAGSAFLSPQLRQLTLGAIFTWTGHLCGRPKGDDGDGSSTHHVGLRLSMVLARELGRRSSI